MLPNRREGESAGSGFLLGQRTGEEGGSQLIRDAGFNPLDLGPLPAARYIEPFSLLTAQIAYGGSNDPALDYRFERFPEHAK